MKGDDAVLIKISGTHTFDMVMCGVIVITAALGLLRRLCVTRRKGGHRISGIRPYLRF